MDLSKIPNRLRGKPYFCLMKLEQKTGKVKKDKVPYRTNGARADPTNPEHFTSLEKVMKVFDKGGYDGIGIGLFDDIIAIDIDDCVENGKLNAMAAEIVDSLGSYAEFSISGTGVHIWARAPGLVYDKERYYINNRAYGLEIYPAGVTTKFIVTTGNAINDCDVNECTDALKVILEKYMIRPSAEKPKVEAPGSYLSDESVIEKMLASKNAEKTKALWEGEIPEGKSHSEADAALCMILAFWCGGDEAQMDRLFRQSALFRDKWDELHGPDTYGNITIRNAIARTTEFYKPVDVGNAREDFNELAIRLTEFMPESNRLYKEGDLGNGRLFADVFKDIARYVPERKKWFIYDGTRWVADIGSLKAMELAKDLADALLIHSVTIKDEDMRNNFIKNVVRKWQQRGYRSVYLSDAQSVYPVPIEKFDGDIYIFNCKNGTLNLRDGTFREHRADDFVTKISPVEYVPLARSERFEEFIDEITCRDKDRARFLQKTLGYGLSGDTRFECMFFYFGETTRNGKGTLMETVLITLGDYGATVRPETIATKYNPNSQNPSEDIARLAGIRFANISEPGRGLLLNAAQVKTMTGSDTLNARFLHENSFDFRPQFKLYVNTNYLPVITDMTVFTSDRVLIVPFERHFEPWEQDKGLKTEFRKPEVQSAVLNWLLEGYALLQKEGLQPPKSVLEATAAYYHESDKVTQFADDRLIEDGTAEVRTSQVYDEYRRWCDENGCYSENSRNFNQELRKFGKVVRKRPKAGGEKTTMLIGYRLKVDFLS